MAKYAQEKVKRVLKKWIKKQIYPTNCVGKLANI